MKKKATNSEHLRSFINRHKAAVIYSNGNRALDRLGEGEWALLCQRLTNLNYLLYRMNMYGGKKWHPSLIGRTAAGIAIFYLTCHYTSDEYYHLSRARSFSRGADHEAVYVAMREFEAAEPPSSMVSELVQSAYHFGISDMFRLSGCWRSVYGGLQYLSFCRNAETYSEEIIRKIPNLTYLPEFADLWLARLPLVSCLADVNTNQMLSIVQSIGRLDPTPNGVPHILRW